MWSRFFNLSDLENWNWNYDDKLNNFQVDNSHCDVRETSCNTVRCHVRDTADRYSNPDDIYDYNYL